MKRSFLTFLPIMAALLLATSCSKDDDTNTVINNEQTNAEPAPVEVVAQPEYVKIPFSVKVDNGAKLSKISYSESDTKITRSFEQSDVDNNLTMAVTGDGIASGSTLTLKKDGTNFVFEGEIEVQSGKEDDFTTTGIELTGTFGTPLTEAATSTTSLLDLMQTCNHEYKATFQSNTTDAIVIYDQNAYFHFTLAPTQTKMKISTGEYSEFKPNADGTKEIWIAVAGGTTVKGNLVSTSGLATVASKIYNANRTDVVDLGLSVLWCTSNANSPETDQKNWEDAKTLAANKTGYDLPTADNFRELTGEKSVEGVIVTKEWKSGDGAAAGYTFSTDYGSVFFPAAGQNGGNAAGVGGSYWSGESDAGDEAYALFFGGGNTNVTSSDVNYEYSVRLVRGL